MRYCNSALVNIVLTCSQCPGQILCTVKLLINAPGVYYRPALIRDQAFIRTLASSPRRYNVIILGYTYRMLMFILLSSSTKIDSGVKLAHLVVRIECFKAWFCNLNAARRLASRFGLLLRGP